MYLSFDAASVLRSKDITPTFSLATNGKGQPVKVAMEVAVELRARAKVASCFRSLGSFWGGCPNTAKTIRLEHAKGTQSQKIRVYFGILR